MFPVTIDLPDGSYRQVYVPALPHRGDTFYTPDDKTFIPQDAYYKVAKIEFECHQDGTATINITLELP